MTIISIICIIYRFYCGFVIDILNWGWNPFLGK